MCNSSLYYMYIFLWTDVSSVAWLAIECPDILDLTVS